MSAEFSIAAVERETGLTRETLRIWERRYGFPSPRRDANGDRLFNGEEVKRLLLIKRLLEMGHRPGRVVPLTEEALHRLERSTPPPAPPDQAADQALMARALDQLARGQPARLHDLLHEALAGMGLQQAILTLLAPLTEAVGEAWLRGELSVHAEHAYSDILQTLLRRSLDSLPPSDRGPRVLLTTSAGELHGLGLLMAECILALEGARCLSLGVNLPHREIAAAADTHAAQVVGLSYSAAYPRRLVGDGLRALSGLLGPEVEIWVGGQSLRHARLPAGIRRCVDLSQVAGLLRDWRQRHPPEAGLPPSPDR